MSIYAFNNPFNNMGQITSYPLIPWGEFAGGTFDDIYYSAHKKNKKILKVRQNDMNVDIKELVKSGDIIITSTLTNLSLDFFTAMRIVADLYFMNVRVIAYQEDFDSFGINERVIIMSLPLMHKFNRQSYKAKKDKIHDGINRAKSKGKYRGRKAYNSDNIKDFDVLYNQYLTREINKGEFAQKINISRPTLDKLIKDYKNK